MLMYIDDVYRVRLKHTGWQLPLRALVLPRLMVTIRTGVRFWFLNLHHLNLVSLDVLVGPNFRAILFLQWR